MNKEIDFDQEIQVEFDNEVIEKLKKKSQEKKDIIDFEKSGKKSRKTNGHGDSQMHRYYGMILYPEEDHNHADVIRYINNHQDYMMYAAINHKGELKDAVELEYDKASKTILRDLDKVSDHVLTLDNLPAPDPTQDLYKQLADLKVNIAENDIKETGLEVYDADAHTLALSYGKDHTHILVDTIKPMTKGSFIKFWGGMVKHCEPISMPTHYVRYMMHDTPASIADGKLPYHTSDLYGSTPYIAKLLVMDETLYFIQLQNETYREYVSMCRAGYSLSYIFQELYLNADDLHQHIFRKCFPNFGYLMVQINNQERSDQKQRIFDK